MLEVAVAGDDGFAVVPTDAGDECVAEVDEGSVSGQFGLDERRFSCTTVRQRERIDPVERRPDRIDL